MACVGQYRKLAACISYNTPILWLLSITYQAGVQYNALTWLVWVSTESWLRVFSYNTPILWLLSITYQAGVPYNALTWLVWVSTESWLRVFFIIHLFWGCLVLLSKLAFRIML